MLENGFGDPLQKSILLGSLLNQQGFSVFPVLVPSDGLTFNKELLYFNQFDRVIVMATKGIDTLYYDPMADNSPIGYIPGASGWSGIVINSSGKVNHITFPEYQGGITVTGNLKILESETVKGEMTLYFFGEYDKYLRSYTKGKRQRKVKMIIEDAMSSMGSEIKLEDFKLSDPENLLIPLILTAKFTGKGFTFTQDYMEVFNIPQKPFENIPGREFVNLEERELPLYLGEEFDIRIEYKLEFPASFTPLYSPMHSEQENELGSYQINSGENFVVYELHSRKRVVSTDDYPKLKELLRSFFSPKNWVILLRK